MKRLSNLYDQICSLENLKLADERARKGKGRSYGVLRHDKNRDTNILHLRENLVNQTYKISPYTVFKIYEPKERLIYRLPYFPDRILHHAIMNVMEPIWVSIFTQDTFSCIKGRGIHKAVNRIKQDLKSDLEGTKYCLKIDIRKFYPSIDHEILKDIIRRKIKDTKLLKLLDEIIDSALGVPIGNYLSQYFANLYLAYFDHWMKEVKAVKYYYRYADDIVILSPDKEKLHALLHEMRAYLKYNLKLTVKRNYQVFPVKSPGIDFLGYRFFHDHILLRKSIKHRFCCQVARLNKSNINAKTYKQQVCSWWGWAKHCNSRHLIHKLFKNAPYEVKFNY
jgi:retron-type reverse transcriptase